jgi:hypothetical protein
MEFLPTACQAQIFAAIIRRIGTPRLIWRGGLCTDYPTWESPLPEIVCQLPKLPLADQHTLGKQFFTVVAQMRGLGNHHDTRKLVRKLRSLYPNTDGVDALGRQLWAHSLVAHFADEVRKNLAWRDAPDDAWQRAWKTFLRLRQRVQRLELPGVWECYLAAEQELQVHPRIAGAGGHH